MKIPTKRNVLIALLMSCKNSLNDFAVKFNGHLRNQLQLLTAVMCMPMFIAVNLDYYGWKYSQNIFLTLLQLLVLSIWLWIFK